MTTMSARSQESNSLYSRQSGTGRNTQSMRNQRRLSQHDRSGNSTEDSGREEDQDDEEAIGVEDINQAVKKLVRYALACDYQRLTIKRSGIIEKVIGKQRGSFKKVFEQAQEQLRIRFGMEMVELPARQKVTLREKKAAQKSKANNKSSTAYILKTILPSEYRNPEIVPPPTDWSTSEELAYIGLYTVIISIISLSADGQMANHQLNRYLKRLNLDRNTGLGTTSELLARMKKESYLQETKILDKDGETSEWRVGPRGLVEVDREAITKFAQRLYGGNAPEDLLPRLQRSLGTEIVKTQEKPGD